MRGRSPGARRIAARWACLVSRLRQSFCFPSFFQVLEVLSSWEWGCRLAGLHVSRRGSPPGEGGIMCSAACCQGTIACSVPPGGCATQHHNLLCRHSLLRFIGMVGRLWGGLLSRAPQAPAAQALAAAPASGCVPVQMASHVHVVGPRLFTSLGNSEHSPSATISEGVYHQCAIVCRILAFRYCSHLNAVESCVHVGLLLKTKGWGTGLADSWLEGPAGQCGAVWLAC